MCIQCILLGALVNAGACADNNTDDSEVDTFDNSSTKCGSEYYEEGTTTFVPPDQLSTTAAYKGRFRCEVLSPFDYTPTQFEAYHLLDESANLYLSDTLEQLRSNHDIHLVPLEVESDGSCLPHAISRCLVGHEVYYDALRLDLHAELTQNASWYRSVLNSDAEGNQVYGIEDWFDMEWTRIVRASSPTYGRQPAGVDKWLGPEHVLGFANLLGRPILLLNTKELMEDLHHGERGGLFLPLRRTRDDILTIHNGNFPSPIVVGYANREGTHYCALVRMKQSEEEEGITIRSVLQKSGSCGLSALKGLWNVHFNHSVREELCVPLSVAMQFPSLDVGEGEFEVEVIHPRSGREMHVFLPPPPSPSIAGEHLLVTADKIYPHWAVLLEVGMYHLMTANGPRVRTRTIKTLRSYVDNVIRAKTDAMTYGKFDSISKVQIIPLHRTAGCRWIVAIPGAQSILEACGYRFFDVDGGNKHSKNNVGGAMEQGDDDNHKNDRKKSFGPMMRLGRPPLCRPLPLQGHAGSGIISSSSSSLHRDEEEEEDRLRQEEGLPLRGDYPGGELTPLYFIRDMLQRLSNADETTMPSSTHSSFERNGFEVHGDEWNIFGAIPRYSWLGIGPPALVDERTGKQCIKPWPKAFLPGEERDEDDSKKLLRRQIWQSARSHYGAGRLYIPDDCWAFGGTKASLLSSSSTTVTSGLGGGISNGSEFCRAVLVDLNARFYTLTRGAFGSMSTTVRERFLHGTADVIVVCPECERESIPPRMTPEERLLSSILGFGGDGGGECPGSEVHCPHPDCGATLDLDRTYRNCVADAVASAAKGALGGVWRCGAPTERHDLGDCHGDSKDDNDHVLLRGGGDTASAAQCQALNVGLSPRCVACGAANPHYTFYSSSASSSIGTTRTSIVSDDGEATAASKIDKEDEMLMLMKNVLEETLFPLPPPPSRKRSISTASLVTSAPSTADDCSDNHREHIAKWHREGSSGETDEGKDKEEKDSSKTTTPTALDFFLLSSTLLTLSSGSIGTPAQRSISQPLNSLTIPSSSYPSSGSSKRQREEGINALRITGARASSKTSVSPPRSTGHRDRSEPITSMEVESCKEHFFPGTNWQELTRNAALDLLRGGGGGGCSGSGCASPDAVDSKLD